MWPRKLKRLVDVAVALMALVAGAPLMILVAAIVRVTLGSPVLFRDQRAGRHGVPFVLLKFRTMRESGGQSDVQRLTETGRWLRRFSLDELPQFWNVLVGDMSLVGPRPLLVRYLPRYSPEQRRRHEVLPGITGWAQVRGRNTVSWPEKLALDVWYVDHWSLRLDLQILFTTVATVLTAKNVTPNASEFMDEFTG